MPLFYIFKITIIIENMIIYIEWNKVIR